MDTKEIQVEFTEQFDFEGDLNFEETHHGDNPFVFTDLMDACQFGWDSAQDVIKQYQEENKKLRDSVALIGGMAGNPNAAEGCRLICVVVRSILKELDK